MRSVIYCRTSLEDQSEYSLEDQEARARAYAEAQGWQVVRVYVDDGGSGQKITRRAFSQMRNELAVLSVKALIVYDLDRFMRNLRAQLDLKYELDQRGVALVSLSDNGIIDTSTPEGMMNFQVKGMVSEFQARTTGRKVRDNLQYKARHGGWVGPVPLGYMKNAQGALVPSPDAPVIQLIFTWYASGNHSFATIAEDLNAAGYTTIDIHTHSRKVFGREAVRSILHNKAYLGMVQCSGVTYQGRHQRLVGQDIWDRCRAIQERRTTLDGRLPTRGDGGLLSEIAYCGGCGGRMHWHISGRTGQPYYRCGRRAGYGKAACDAKMVNAAQIEDRARELLQLLAIPAHLRDRVLFEVQRRSATVAPKQHDRAVIQRQLNRLKAAYLAGDEDLTDDVYFRERERLTKLLNAQPATPTPSLGVAAALDMLSTISTAITAVQLPEQRAIVQQVFKIIWIEKGAITAFLPTRHCIALVEALAEGRTVGSGCLTGFEGTLPTVFPPRWGAFQTPLSL